MRILPGGPSPVDRRPRDVLARRIRARRLAVAVHGGARLLEAAVREVVRRRHDSTCATTRSIVISRRAAEKRRSSTSRPRPATTKRYTYRELAAEVNRFAAILKAQGVGRGDRVLIYMPMIAGSVLRDARVRAHRRDPLRRVRRVRGGEPRHAHRRRGAEADGDLRRRHAWRQADSLQASRRRGAAARGEAAAQGAHRQSRARPEHADGRGPRPRLRGGARRP